MDEVVKRATSTNAACPKCGTELRDNQARMALLRGQRVPDPAPTTVGIACCVCAHRFILNLQTGEVSELTGGDWRRALMQFAHVIAHTGADETVEDVAKMLGDIANELTKQSIQTELAEQAERN